MPTKRKTKKRKARRKAQNGGRDLQAIIASLGPNAQSQIGIARGESEGTLDAGSPLIGLSPNELSQIDRQVFMRDVTRNNPIAGMVGAPLLAGTDLLKATGLQETVAPPIMRMLGFDEKAVSQFGPANEHTSDRSVGQTLSNIGSTGRGFWEGLKSLYENLDRRDSRSTTSRPSASTPVRGSLGGRAGVGRAVISIPRYGGGGGGGGAGKVAGAFGGAGRGKVNSGMRNFSKNFGNLGLGKFRGLYNKQKGRINDINAPTGRLDSLVNNLASFRAGGDRMINDLRNFDPFNVGGVSGTNALQEGINTGFRQDVSGLTDAAKIRAGQEFDLAQDRIGERLGALGLTSSSARARQIAREKGRAAERVAATGLEAEVGANEAAANRRLSFLGLLGQGAGLNLSGLKSALQGRLGQEQMRLSGLQSAAQGAATSSGQQLQASTARAGAGQNLLSSLPSFGSVFGGPTGTSGPSMRLGNRSSGGSYRIPTGGRPPVFRPDGTISQYGSGRYSGVTTPFGGPGPTRFARGGSTRSLEDPRGSQGRNQREIGIGPNDLENFLMNFGADLMRGQGGIMPVAGSQDARDVYINQALAALGGVDGAKHFFQNPDALAQATQQGSDFFNGRSFGVGVMKPRNAAQYAALNIGQELQPASVQGLNISRKQRAALGIDPTSFIGSPEELEKTAVRANRPDPLALANRQFLAPSGGIGDINASERGNAVDMGRGRGLDILGVRGSAANRQFFCGGGPVRQLAQGGGVAQPELPNELGIQVPGLNDPRRQFFEDGGGVAPGEDTGEDKIPALLRSEELVVTPELVQQLEGADPMVPQPQLIAALQQLAQKPLEFAEAEGEFVAENGGYVDSLFSYLFGNPNGPQGTSPTPDTRQSIGAWWDSLAAGPDQPITAETNPELFGQAPLYMSGEQFAGEATLPTPPELPAVTPELSGTGYPESPDMRERAAQGLIRGELGIPSPAEIESALAGQGADDGLSVPSSFAVNVDPVTGIRSFELSGSPGVQGLEEGLGRPLRGNVTETPIIRDENGVALRDTFPVESRLERAQRRADMIRGILNSDPVGGPQKQARLFNSLQAAEREVDAAINEIIAANEQAIAAQNAKSQSVAAQASLNNSIAAALNAQANKATADSQVAKQLLEAASTDPVVAQVLNAFEVASKFKDTNPEMQAQLEAVIRRQLESRGLQLIEPGFLARLFGAPEFEVQPIRPESLPEGVENNVEVPAEDPLMSVLTPEQLAILHKFGI